MCVCVCVCVWNRNERAHASEVATGDYTKAPPVHTLWALGRAVTTPGIVPRPDAKVSHVLPSWTHAWDAFYSVSDALAVTRCNSKEVAAVLAAHALGGILIRRAIARAAQVLSGAAFLFAPGTRSGVVARCAVAHAVYVEAKVALLVARHADAGVSVGPSAARL